MIRFLHISDVHLNKTFSTKNDMIRQRLQRTLLKSFQQVIEFCIEKKLDALLIAGDLFDSNQLSLRDRVFIKDAFKKLGQYDIEVYYASGNHDFTSHDSDIRKIDFSKNVHLFFDDVYQMADLIDKDTKQVFKVVGCGHMLEHETRNLIESFPVGPYIGLVHSMVESNLTKGDEGQYLPSTLETIKQKKYQYFALGHVHSAGAIDKDETIYYSGVLQGLNRNETGPKGGNLVTISDGNMNVEKITFSEVLYEQINFDTTNIKSLDALYDALYMVLEHLEEKSRLAISMNLTGRSHLYGQLRNENELNNLVQMILERLDLFDLLIKNYTKSTHNAKAFQDKKSVLGAILNQTAYIKNMGDLPDLDYLSKSTNLTTETLMATFEDDLMDLFLEDSDEN